MGAGRGVKLLLDENLSRRLVPALQDAYPGTTQVILAGLEQASDRDIWKYAKNGGFTIVSKDEDFLGMLAILGYPPKVVLLALEIARTNSFSMY
jgi:predicted nuclease of predicted toxin-antitoxin system